MVSQNFNNSIDEMYSSKHIETRMTEIPPPEVNAPAEGANNERGEVPTNWLVVDSLLESNVLGLTNHVQETTRVITTRTVENEYSVLIGDNQHGQVSGGASFVGSVLLQLGVSTVPTNQPLPVRRAPMSNAARQAAWRQRKRERERGSSSSNVSPIVTRGSKHWLLTVFGRETLDRDEETMCFLLYQVEQCVDTGKKHLQACVGFNEPVTMSVVKHAFGQETHCEPVKNLEKAINYCRKQFTRVAGPFLSGTLPSSRGFSLAKAYNQLYSGVMTLEEFVHDHPVEFVQHAFGIGQLMKQREKLLSETPKADVSPNINVIYISGPCGIGKTSYIKKITQGKPVYWVSKNLDFFDGLTINHKVLVVDEIDKLKPSFNVLLQVLENPAVTFWTKGGYTRASINEIYLLANKKVDQVFTGDNLEGVFRRGGVVHLSISNGQVLATATKVDQAFVLDLTTHCSKCVAYNEENHVLFHQAIWTETRVDIPKTTFEKTNIKKTFPPHNEEVRVSSTELVKREVKTELVNEVHVSKEEQLVVNTCANRNAETDLGDECEVCEVGGAAAETKKEEDDGDFGRTSREK